MIKPDVKAAPPKRIANPPFLIGCKDDERNSVGFHRSVVETLGLPKGVAFVKPADAQLVP